MLIRELLESTDDFDQLTPKEQAEYERHMKEYYKHREKKLTTQLNTYINSKHIKKTKAGIKRIPKGAELTTVFGRPHLILTQHPEDREHIKTLIKWYDQAKDAQTDTSRSIREIAQHVEQTKKRSANADAVILAAATKYANGQRKQKMRNGKMSDADNTGVYICRYIENAVTSPWPEMEALVFKFFTWAQTYWTSVYKKGPWPKYERFLLNQMAGTKSTANHLVIEYTKLNKQSGWPELEAAYIQRLNSLAPTAGEVSIATSFVEYCTITKTRNLSAAMYDKLVKHAYVGNCLDYAVKMRMRWPAAERKNELRHQQTSYQYITDIERRYAIMFMGGKWPAIGI